MVHRHRVEVLARPTITNRHKETNMSAFIVTDATITGLLQATSADYPGDGADYYWQDEARYFGGHAQEIGQKLVDENYRSVNYRYQEAGQPHEYQHRNVRSLTPVEIIKLCGCYEYQACETPDWESTEAHAILEVIKSRAIRRLPGYDEASWDLREGVGH